MISEREGGNIIFNLKYRTLHIATCLEHRGLPRLARGWDSAAPPLAAAGPARGGSG